MYLLAILSGVLYFLGFVGFEQWYLSWFCFIPIFFALEGVSAKKGFFLGLLFGTSALVGGFYWVSYTMRVFAHMPWVLSILGCLVLSIAQAMEFALFGLAYVFLRRRTGLSPVILGPIVFVAAEFIAPQLFPHYLANSQYRIIPLIQICELTGVLGLSFVIVLVNAVLYVVARDFLKVRVFRWRPLAAGALLLCALIAFGYWRISVVDSRAGQSPKIRFGIAQVNMGINEKERNPQKAIALHQEQTSMLKYLGAELVVWPETAIQAPLLESDMDFIPNVIFDDLNIPLLTGALQLERIDGKRRIFNVGVLAGDDGRILGVYKKRKLLMLGEYIPLGERFPKLYSLFPYIGRITPGSSSEPLKFGEYLFGVNICYEEILPRLINDMMKSSPHVIINLTNDNWFGKTHEPIQHLVLSAFRSVEHRRWLVRSTNTGISAFVDSVGRIVQRSPLMEPAMLVNDVPMMTGRTVYAVLGDWLGWLCLFLSIGLALKPDPSV